MNCFNPIESSAVQITKANSECLIINSIYVAPGKKMAHRVVPIERANGPLMDNKLIVERAVFER